MKANVPQTEEVTKTDRLESEKVAKTAQLSSEEVAKTDRFEGKGDVSPEKETSTNVNKTSQSNEVTNELQNERANARVEPEVKQETAKAELERKQEVAKAEAETTSEVAKPPLVGTVETSQTKTETPNSKQVPPAECLAIFGSGLAGSSAALAACSKGISPLLITGPTLGGALASPETVDYWPGAAPNAKSSELAAALHAQVARLGTRFMHDSVQSININVHPYAISTKLGGLITASAIIIATGLTPKTLNLKDEVSLLGRSVFMSAATINGPHKDAAIVGSDSSAISEALALSKMVSKVTLIYTASQLSCPPALSSQLSQATNIRVECNVKVLAYVTDESDGGPLLRGLSLKRAEETFEIIATVAVLALGSEPKVDLLPPEAKTAEGFVKANLTDLNLKGIFAAGVIVESTPNQLIMLSASGFTAATAAVQYLSAAASKDVAQPAAASTDVKPKLAEAEAKAPASVQTSPAKADVTSKPAKAGVQTSAEASSPPVSQTSAASAAPLPKVAKQVPTPPGGK
ncbi:MAG: FAD-dependent oxidoreductase [Candidatus Hodgkinia cicadicola]